MIAASSIGVNSASAQEDTSSPPVALKPGDAFSDYYSLVASDPQVHFDCDFVLQSLNRPKPYDLGNTWDLLIGTEYNYFWERLGDDRRTWAWPATLGDVPPGPGTSDRLSLDVDGDGAPETFFRFGGMYGGQLFTSLSVKSASLPKDADQTQESDGYEIKIKDVAPQPPLNIAPGRKGDFYVVDLINVEGRKYVIAADSVFAGDDGRVPNVYVLKFEEDLNLNVVCLIQATAPF
jgi:hypothetical protein